ncbi:unnamed protein product [Eruca vesicaria subsp. sativa]|uniref:Uncharacterized protein n=1 Tax=Eruca vesicaria subsp. sativa TaxID=29727 RepID=A0ABC8KKP2_ERUVS|nr:unnamed protein product [Eruca vesicaria subsp. sativa]
MRTRSRLSDPPTEMKLGRISKSGQIKSGLKSPRNQGGEEEEDNPFAEEDLPEEYRRDKISLWIVLECLSLILIIAALVCTLAIRFLRDKVICELHLWKWETMVLVLICGGRFVSSWIVKIVVFFVERNFVYVVRKAVQNCLWLGLAWHLLFDEKVDEAADTKALPVVTKIIVCLLVGFLLWLVKTLLVKVLASSQLFRLGFFSSFCTKVSHTVSSEIGKAFGKTTYLATTFKIVLPRGTEGAMSVEGTLAGFLASSFLASGGCFLGQITPPEAAVCVLSSQIANLGESIIGASFQDIEGFKWLNNDVVNVINISLRSIVAILMQQFILQN